MANTIGIAFSEEFIFDVKFRASKFGINLQTKNSACTSLESDGISKIKASEIRIDGIKFRFQDNCIFFLTEDRLSRFSDSFSLFDQLQISRTDGSRGSFARFVDSLTAELPSMPFCLFFVDEIGQYTLNRVYNVSREEMSVMMSFPAVWMTRLWDMDTGTTHFDEQEVILICVRPA